MNEKVSPTSNEQLQKERPGYVRQSVHDQVCATLRQKMAEFDIEREAARLEIERLRALVRCAEAWTEESLEKRAHETRARQPDGYAYRYGDGYIRFNGGGRVNGGDPTESIPYYLGTPPVETVAKPPIVAWAVGNLLDNPAVYNIRQFEQASDAARRWNSPITGLVQAPNTPTFAPRDAQETASETSACSLPSPSDTRESAIAFIVGVAKDTRFSTEYVGNVVRSWLDKLGAVETAVPRLDAITAGRIIESNLNLRAENDLLRKLSEKASTPQPSAFEQQSPRAYLDGLTICDCDTPAALYCKRGYRLRTCDCKCHSENV